MNVQLYCITFRAVVCGSGATPTKALCDTVALDNTDARIILCPKVMCIANTTNSSVQLSLFPCQGSSVNDAQNGSAPVAKLSTYMKTREALWRLIASYPKCMPVEDAIRRARIDFAKPRKEVVAL